MNSSPATARTCCCPPWPSLLSSLSWCRGSSPREQCFSAVGRSVSPGSLTCSSVLLLEFGFDLVSVHLYGDYDNVGNGLVKVLGIIVAFGSSAELSSATTCLQLPSLRLTVWSSLACTGSDSSVDNTSSCSPLEFVLRARSLPVRLSEVRGHTGTSAGGGVRAHRHAEVQKRFWPFTGRGGWRWSHEACHRHVSCVAMCCVVPFIPCVGCHLKPGAIPRTCNKVSESLRGSDSHCLTSRFRIRSAGATRSSLLAPSYVGASGPDTIRKWEPSQELAFWKIPYFVNRHNWSSFPFNTRFFYLVLVRRFFLGLVGRQPRVTSQLLSLALPFNLDMAEFSTWRVLPRRHSGYWGSRPFLSFWPPVVLHFRSFFSRLSPATSTDKHRRNFRHHLDLRKCCGWGFLLAAVRVFWPRRHVRRVSLDFPERPLGAVPVEWHCRANLEHISGVYTHLLSTLHTQAYRSSEVCLKQDSATIQGRRVLVVSLGVFASSTGPLICRRGFDLLFLGMCLRHETAVHARSSGTSTTPLETRIASPQYFKPQ